MQCKCFGVEVFSFKQIEPPDAKYLEESHVPTTLTILSITLGSPGICFSKFAPGNSQLPARLSHLSVPVFPVGNNNNKLGCMDSTVR